MTDDRAVSIAITHALTIAITTVLLSGLLISSGALLESQEQRVSNQQLSEIGSDVLSYLHDFDRMSSSGEDVQSTVTPNYPDRIVDSYAYTIELRETANGYAGIEIRTHRLDQSVQYEIALETDIQESTVRGGDVEINLCKDPQEITVGGCD